MPEIFRATVFDAPQLKKIAVAKANWGYPAEWMTRWADWINVSPAFIEKYEVYKAVDITGERMTGRLTRAGAAVLTIVLLLARGVWMLGIRNYSGASA